MESEFEPVIKVYFLTAYSDTGCGRRVPSLINQHWSAGLRFAFASLHRRFYMGITKTPEEIYSCPLELWPCLSTFVLTFVSDSAHPRASELP